MVNALSVNIKYDECGLGAGHIIGLQARGGMPPFRYEWVNENGTVVGQAANATGLTEGRYRLTITDANGCAVQSEAYVIPNNWSQLDAPQAPDVFYLCSPGQVTIPFTGIPDYRYRLYDVAQGGDNLFTGRCTMTTTLYPARKIITLNPDRPQTDCVAVRDGRILGTGPREELAQWGEHVIDTRFADKILLPGFVEGHCHLSQGALWRFVYVGQYDRTDPDGRLWPGLHTLDAVIERLRTCAAALPADKPLVGWGFDPVSLPQSRCTRHPLDQAFGERCVALMHASMHVLTANSAALKRADFLRPGIDHPGVPLDRKSVGWGKRGTRRV